MISSTPEKQCKGQEPVVSFPHLRDTNACHGVEEVELNGVPRPGHRLGNDDPGTCGEYCIEEAPPESVQGVKESSGEL